MMAAHQETVLCQSHPERVDELRERLFIAGEEIAGYFGVSLEDLGHILMLARFSDGVIRFASRLDAAGAGHSSLHAEAGQHPAHNGDVRREQEDWPEFR